MGCPRGNPLVAGTAPASAAEAARNDRRDVPGGRMVGQPVWSRVRVGTPASYPPFDPIGGFLTRRDGIPRPGADRPDTLLVEDQAAFLPLPARSFEARRVTPATANGQSLVRFDTNDW